MKLNKNMFREYDIRGIFGEDLTKETVETLGLAIGTYLRSKGIRKTIIGRDCRLSSDSLFQWLSDGLVSTGIDIVDAGMIPTPVLYFAAINSAFPSGIMITGSHNPPEFNGFKVQTGDSTIYGKEIQKLYEITCTGKFESGKGNISSIDALTPYHDYIVKDIKPARIDIKFAVDFGNGTAGVIAPRIMKTLGFDPILLYDEPDGRFPNHHPDPTVPEYLKDLIEKVKQEKAELGIAYDGDADRIGVVDGDGKILWGDQLLIIFSRAILKENLGAKILGEVKCSKVLYDEIEKHGGKPIMWKTGHSLIKAKIKEEGALLGGEMSGHMFFAHRYFGFDDAIYASLRLLELVSKHPDGFKGLIADIPTTVFTPEIRVECPDDKKFAVVKNVLEVFKKRKDISVIDIDGVRVNYPSGWGLVRASNTQPVLVLRFEADNEENLAKIKKEVETVVEQARKKL